MVKALPGMTTGWHQTVTSKLMCTAADFFGGKAWIENCFEQSWVNWYFLKLFLKACFVLSSKAGNTQNSKIEQCAHFQTLCSVNTVRCGFYSEHCKTEQRNIVEETMVMGQPWLKIWKAVLPSPLATEPPQQCGPLPGHLSIWPALSNQRPEWRSRVYTAPRTGTLLPGAPVQTPGATLTRTQKHRHGQIRKEFIKIKTNGSTQHNIQLIYYRTVHLKLT